jgi:hypothetical protein
MRYRPENAALFWATHRSSFSDVQFREMADNVCPYSDQEKRNGFRHALLRRLQILGHVARDTGFVVLPPRLIIEGSGTPPRATAFLAGARTPSFIEWLLSRAEARSLQANLEELTYAPDRIGFEGDIEGVRALAEDCKCQTVEDAPWRALRAVADVSDLQSGGVIQLPRDAAFDVFDFSDLTWRRGVPKEREACGLTERTGASRYFVRTEQGFVEMSRHEAVFVAAGMKRIPLCDYVGGRRAFLAKTQLPLNFVRCLALCTGRPGCTLREAGARIHEPVPEDLARELLRKLGQYDLVFRMPLVWFD